LEDASGREGEGGGCRKKEGQRRVRFWRGKREEEAIEDLIKIKIKFMRKLGTGHSVKLVPF